MYNDRHSLMADRQKQRLMKRLLMAETEQTPVGWKEEALVNGRDADAMFNDSQVR